MQKRKSIPRPEWKPGVPLSSHLGRLKRLRRTKRNFDPSYHADYDPEPCRTLATARDWRTRVLDLRYSVPLTQQDLARLSGIPAASIVAVELNREPYHPFLSFILRIRKLEEVFHEELVQYLFKPHNRMAYRIGHGRILDVYGGYKKHGVSSGYRPVSFTGHTFEDIAQMEDVAAIRALKVIKPHPFDIHRHTGPQVRPVPEPGAYYRVLESASRGHFIPVAEIARIVAGDQDQKPGQPVSP